MTTHMTTLHPILPKSHIPVVEGALAAFWLGAVALFGPPALAFGIGWLVWRRFGRRWRPVAGAAAA